MSLNIVKFHGTLDGTTNDCHTASQENDMNDTMTVGTIKSSRDQGDGTTRLTVNVRGEDVTVYVDTDSNHGQVIGVEEDEDGNWHVNDLNPTPDADSTVEAAKSYVAMYRVAAETQVAVLLRKRSVGSIRFRISPRWGCGSPSDLPMSAVIDVAMDDVRCHAHAASGFYGTDQQEEARDVDALKGIAVAYWYARCHWHRVDLLTGAVTLDPEQGRKRCKHTRITQADWDLLAHAARTDHEALSDLHKNRAKLLGKEAI